MFREGCILTREAGEAIDSADGGVPLEVEPVVEIFAQLTACIIRPIPGAQAKRAEMSWGQGDHVLVGGRVSDPSRPLTL